MNAQQARQRANEYNQPNDEELSGVLSSIANRSESGFYNLIIEGVLTAPTVDYLQSNGYVVHTSPGTTMVSWDEEI